MKNYYLLLVLSLILFACRKGEMPEGGNQSNNNIEQIQIVDSSSVSMKLNGKEVIITKIAKERSLALGYLSFAAENDSIKIELKINSINQTGNTTGLILVGEYNWSLYLKKAESGFVKYSLNEQRLGVYNDKPLTDQKITGEFSFKAQYPGDTEINNITEGRFRLLF